MLCVIVPLQRNYDPGDGPMGDGDRWLRNVQLVVPFGLNDERNLISRTILPVVRQSDIFTGAALRSRCCLPVSRHEVLAVST